MQGLWIGKESNAADEGRITSDLWFHTATLHPYVILDEFVVMPNHIHINPRNWKEDRFYR